MVDLKRKRFLKYSLRSFEEKLQLIPRAELTLYQGQAPDYFAPSARSSHPKN